MRKPRNDSDGHRSGKPAHLAHRSTISSTLHATHPRHLATIAEKRSSHWPTEGGKDHVSDRLETTVTSPGAPLSSYTGPTPKSLDGVRAAFFETKGMSLESITE